MESCVECFQLCILCSEPTLDCPLCNQLQDVHWKQVHASAFSKSNPGNIVSSQTTNASHGNGRDGNQNPPISRRREWTAEENRSFEKWITNNPKPTKQQKLDFANSHNFLTLSQVQNKINNWRNGRNIRTMQAAPAPDTSLDWPRDSLPIMDTSVRETGFTRVTKDSKPKDLIKQFESELLPLSRDSLTKALELAVTDSEVQNRPNSPGSSIMRYISSSELEADYVDIETALRTASLEDLNAEDTASICMRLPSLKHKTSLVESACEEDSHGSLRKKISSDAEGIQGGECCDRCKDWDLECDPNRPCLPCSRSGVPCSNDPMRIATHLCSHLALPSHLQGIPSYGQSWIPGSQINKPMSEAQSIGSSASYSTGSTHSARYSLKLNRRLSANIRRRSATDIRLAPPSARSLKQLYDGPSAQPLSINDPRDSWHVIPRIPSVFLNAYGTNQNDGRAEYFECPAVNCTEVFNSRASLRNHEDVHHFLLHCTFCEKSFRDHRTWRFHERFHFGISGGWDDVLWNCGICSIFGLREARRYLHIGGHWEEGTKRADWKGKPQIMPLSIRDIVILENLPSHGFAVTAERLLSEFACCSSPSMEAADKILEPERARASLRSKTAGVQELQQGQPCTKIADQPSETSQPRVQGLFASLRRKLPRIKFR